METLQIENKKVIETKPIMVNLQFIETTEDDGSIWYETILNGSYVYQSGSYDFQVASAKYNNILNRYNK